MRTSFYRLIFFSLVTGILLAGCNGCFRKDISDVAPEPLTDITTIDLPESSFNIPISFSINKLEDLINHKINGTFLETNINPLGSEKDEAKLSFTKTKPINIRTVKNELVCKITLQVDGALLKSRYGGFVTNQVKPMQTEVTIELSTPVNLNNDWSLDTKFKLKSLKWVKEPILQVGPFKKNIRDKIEEWLYENDTKLTNLLDDELTKAVSLKPAIGRIWSDLQKPIVIHKNVPVAWMKFSCDSIGGKIVLEKDNVKCYTNVKAKMLMITDTSKLAAAIPLPPYRALNKIIEESDIYLYAFTSFDEINAELSSRFTGKTISAKGYTVIIDSIKTYASTAGLSLQVKTSKDVEGTVVASGKLSFDSKTHQMNIRDFDYAISTNKTILNAGDQLLHSIVQDSIASRLTLGLDTLIQLVPEIVENAIAKGKPGNTIDLSLYRLDIKDCDITMGAERIHFKIHAGAKAGIQLKKINPGKRVNIKTSTAIK